MYSVFLINISQYMPECAETISSRVNKVLCVAKVHMSLSAVCRAAASVDFAFDVSLVSILQTGD